MCREVEIELLKLAAGTTENEVTDVTVRNRAASSNRTMTQVTLTQTTAALAECRKTRKP
jgi:hypothetical protein